MKINNHLYNYSNNCCKIAIYPFHEKTIILVHINANVHKVVIAVAKMRKRHQ